MADPEEIENPEQEREAQYRDDNRSALYTAGIGISSLMAPFCLYRMYKSILRAKKMFDIQMSLEEDDLNKIRPDKYCMVKGTA